MTESYLDCVIPPVLGNIVREFAVQEFLLFYDMYNPNMHIYDVFTQTWQSKRWDFHEADLKLLRVQNISSHKYFLRCEEENIRVIDAFTGIIHAYDEPFQNVNYVYYIIVGGILYALSVLDHLGMKVYMGTWIDCASLKYPRSHYDITTAGGKIYVGGTGRRYVPAPIECYDP